MALVFDLDRNPTVQYSAPDIAREEIAERVDTASLSNIDAGKFEALGILDKFGAVAEMEKIPRHIAL